MVDPKIHNREKPRKKRHVSDAGVAEDVSGSREALIAHSQELLDAFAAKSPIQSGVPSSLNESESLLRTELETYLPMFEALHTGDAAAKEAARKEAIALLKLKDNPKADRAIIAVEAHLEKLVKDTYKSSPTAKTVAAKKAGEAYDKRRATHEAQVETQEVEHNTALFEKEGRGVFTRMLDKHEKMIEGKSDLGRLGISVSEMVIGGMVTSVGSSWLSQSIRGLKEGKVISTDANGKPVADVVVKPMPSTERVLKATLGAAGVGVGIGATIMGFVGVFRGPTQLR